ncbi:ropporin-1-like [Lepisosteus oculatus]|nr:PREDICTED: ropporin-1-like [Lepisosteus oculatus]
MPLSGKQVIIPPELPDILKQFTKAAIRTQPADLLEWSSIYFTALANGQPLPVRARSDQNAAASQMDLTPELLKALHTEFGERETVHQEEVELKWNEFGLPVDLLKHIIVVGHFDEELEWMKFLALGCSYLGGTIKNAMIHACYILNSDPNSTPPDACVPYDMFKFLYTYLADVDREVSQDQVNQVLKHLETQVVSSEGVVKVSDFMNNRKLRLG